MGDFREYEHQVGGWHNGSASHILKDSGGHILKPLKLNANPTYDASLLERDASDVKLQNADQELIPVCRDEGQFYETVKKSAHPDDVSLLPLMPSFYGITAVVDESGKSKPHLILEDLAAGMKLPCITDLKVGYTTYYPTVEQKKKKSAPPSSQKELGFCLTGMRVYNPDSGELVVSLLSGQSKTLTTEQVLEHLLIFCQHKHPQYQLICDSIVSSLKEIHKWFSKQRSYIIRTSSVLLVYDASEMNALGRMGDSSKEATQEDSKSKLKVRVKMIDFAHVLKAYNGKDDNYISSLESLINIFSNKINRSHLEQ